MPPRSKPDPESQRLAEDARREKNWKRWGPYLSERQWGTVREDYSANGDPWDYFTFDQSHSRAYRWGEDGLLGITDREGRLCFALAMWNGRDPILKERLFGLTGPQGNHGEDVKECYFYLDSTPSHSYMKALYKYPQAEFPYAHLIDENRRRGKLDPEFELLDTGVFDENRYFDVFAEYAKSSPNDVLIKLTIANRGPDNSTLHMLPTLWFRNTWSWGRTGEGYWPKPCITKFGEGILVAEHATLGRFYCAAQSSAEGQPPSFLFTDNETDAAKLFGVTNPSSFVKDAFHEYIIKGRKEGTNSADLGTKAAVHYVLELPPGGEKIIKLRLYAEDEKPPLPFGPEFDQIFEQRHAESDGFYAKRIPSEFTEEKRRVARQSYAGLLWTKQFYYYAVEDWLEGDPAQPKPPVSRQHGRNSDWTHLYNRDVISMPDNWEYPWYAAWDHAFHMIPFAHVDPQFAKEQLILFLREWYMHPNGQLPAYEWSFSDVNPPVHAWAAWRVYKMTGPRGRRDRLFLERVFQKQLLNFTWWVNRKDLLGKHLFAGGFLGMDNVSLFDRSQPVPDGGVLEQADGTAWMAFYCTTMLAIALELAHKDPAYEDVASKFFEHFVAIVDAMNSFGGSGLWDEEDGFYYDRLKIKGNEIPLRIRSLVGIVPLFAVEVLEDSKMERLPGFRKRLQWFLDNRQDLARYTSYMEAKDHDGHGHRLLAIPSRERLERVLHRVLDESEFLSPFGVRSLSRVHKDHPFKGLAGDQHQVVEYEPGESRSNLFGGNSNWRGPIWLPTNYLLIEALERYHHFYGDTFQMECPTGSGIKMDLGQVARELASRLVRIFLPDEKGRRPYNADDPRFAADPHWRDLVLFYEYFHGDNGKGLGASHQTGWTSLVTRLLESCDSKSQAARLARNRTKRASHGSSGMGSAGR
ncbi:MAG: MGH1-like glycoside hydrolase domain-containing protein [Gemmataceae bacterium]